MECIYVSGDNSHYQLFVEGNNFAQTSPYVCPPEKVSSEVLNISNLNSISSYCFHSIIVQNDGRAFAIGEDRGFYIGTKKRKKYNSLKMVSIDSNNERFVSAVCGGTFSLYLTVNDTLIFCHEKGNNAPFFFKLHKKTRPIALFGGHRYAAVVDHKGDLFVITEDIFKIRSTENFHFHFPDQIIDLCCCDDFLLVLTKNGRVFGNGKLSNQNFNNSKNRIANSGYLFSNFPDFREIVEFYESLPSKDEIAVQISGTFNHCFIVTNFGNVFGYGANFEGQLGIFGSAKVEYSTFVKIESFLPETVVKASAGVNHSLFITKSGKLLTCGANKVGQLLLGTKGEDNANVPVETFITSHLTNRVTFVISGDSISIVVANCEPPPFTPNMPIRPEKYNTAVDIKEPDVDFTTSIPKKTAKIATRYVPSTNPAKPVAASSSPKNARRVDLNPKPTEANHKDLKKTNKNIPKKKIKNYDDFGEEDDDDAYFDKKTFLKSTKPYSFLDSKPLSASASTSSPTSTSTSSFSTVNSDNSKKKEENLERRREEPDLDFNSSMSIKAKEKKKFFSKKDCNKSVNELIQEVNYYRKLCRALENEVQSSHEQVAKKQRVDTFLHGNTLGRIDISQLENEGIIARGAQAEVRKMKYTNVTFFAMKIIHNSTFDSSKNFLRECEIMMSAKHPCIVKIHAFNFGEMMGDVDFGDDAKLSKDLKNLPKIILSYYPYNLKKEIKNLSNTGKVRVFVEILIGMRFMQEEKKIIHRDLKPENILLNKSKHARIGDFGLAIAYGLSTTDSLTKGIGTMAFMAPELLNEDEYGPKVDQYSMGILLFFILTNGELPSFKIADIIVGKKFAIPEYVNDFSRELIRRMCNFDPNERPLFSQIIDNLKENKFALMEKVESNIIEERLNYLGNKESVLFEK